MQSGRSRWFGFGVTAAIAAIAAVAWLAAPNPGGTHALSGVSGDVASAAAAGTDPAGSNQGQGMTGQIFGIDGLCLDGTDGGGAGGNRVTLATCDGASTQQQWTLLADKEIVVNGRCLGVDPDSATGAALAGLYACTGTAPVTWTVGSDRTIRSASSGLCLGTRENEGADGALVAVTACEPNAKAQTWTVPNTALDPSGVAMPVGNIPGWRQVFTDDFAENVPAGDFPAAVSGKWGDYLDGWPDSSHHGTYEPTKVVSIGHGVMNLFLHTQDGIHMVAAPYPKIPAATGSAGGNVYGMYEVRFNAQQVAGYKTSWLLWPDSGDEAQGEIDFPEGNLQQTIDAFMHHVGPDFKSQDAYVTSSTYAGWHTAATIWTAKSVIFILDGKVIGDSTDKFVIPNTPMHWVLQTETRIGHGPPPDAATANVKIDWVSAWFPENSK